MGALNWLLVLGLFAGPAAAAPIDRWSDPIAEASRRFGVPPQWIRNVMAAESGGRTTLAGRPIRSSAEAIGLMQLMPATWAEMRTLYRLGEDPDDPRDNILAGTAYLRRMYDRFGYPGLFAAYNAGPARYAEHLATGRRLPAETVAYVATVGRMPLHRSVSSLTRSAQVPVFVSVSRSQAGRPALPAAALFAPLTTTPALLDQAFLTQIGALGEP